MAGERFTRWSEHEDRRKGAYLAEIGGSWLSDEEALELINRDLVAEGRQPITETTIRTWAREDPEFAQALKAARQRRAEELRYQAARAQVDDGSMPPRWGSRILDPFQRRFSALREHASAGDWLSWLKQAQADAGGPAGPGEQKFIAITDMDPTEARVAAAQQEPQKEAEPAYNSFGPKPNSGNPGSFPQRVDENGVPVREGFLVTPTGVVPVGVDTAGRQPGRVGDDGVPRSSKQ
jgi:hypothetical protein